MDEEKSLNEKLMLIQSELKAPKNQRNTFGEFNYRSCEDIFEAVKPLLFKYKCSMTVTDDLVLIGQRYYIKASATIKSGSETITASAYAREPDSKPKMDSSQVTGSTSSYARKYALNGLFLIDDAKDPDTDEYHRQEEQAKTGSANTEEVLATKDERDHLVQTLLRHGYSADSVPPLGKLTHRQYMYNMRRYESEGNSQ